MSPIELRQDADRAPWGWMILSPVLTHFYFKLDTSAEGPGGGGGHLFIIPDYARAGLAQREPGLIKGCVPVA